MTETQREIVRAMTEAADIISENAKALAESLGTEKEPLPPFSKKFKILDDEYEILEETADLADKILEHLKVL